MIRLARIFQILLATSIASPFTTRAEWVYTNYAPWFWDAQINTWIYTPGQPQLVWYDNDAWRPNPMLAGTYDLREVFGGSPLELHLLGEGVGQLTLRFNLSGLPGAYLSISNIDYPADCVYTYDAVLGTACFYIFWSDIYEAPHSVALFLRFESSEGGNYEILGDFGKSLCLLCHYSGTFVLNQVTGD